MSGAALCLLITDVAFALGPSCILWHSRSELVLTSMEINQRDNSRDTAGHRFGSFQELIATSCKDREFERFFGTGNARGLPPQMVSDRAHIANPG
jgi:hypothetical protein